MATQLLVLELEEPFETPKSDKVFRRSMKLASLSLLRAMERERGLHPVVERGRFRPPPAAVPLHIREGVLGKSIVEAVAVAYELTYEDVVGRSRKQHVMCARVLATRVLRDQVWNDGSVRFSTPQIGRILGGRDHSTVCHSLGIFEIYCKVHPFMHRVYYALSDKGEDA